MSVGEVHRDEATAPWFDGTARGELLLRRCPAGHWLAPQARQCSRDGSTELVWAPSAGVGSLVSWSVTESRPAADGTVTRTAIGIVELSEGPWWWTQLRVADDAALHVGLALQVAFERSGDDGEAVPVFAPAGGSV